MSQESRRAADHMVQYSRGVLLFRQGQYSQALEELDILRLRGDMLGRLGRYYLGMSHRALGVEALTAGRFDDAGWHLRQAMDLIGRQGDLASYMASLYARQNQHARCAAVLEDAVDSGPSPVADWRRLAQAQWRAGRRPLAYMTLHKAIAAMGNQPSLLLQMGLFHSAEEQFAQALPWLQRAAQADCANAQAHYYCGLAAAAGGDVQEAVRSLQRAFELRPQDLLAAYQLSLAARAAAEQGQVVNVRLPEKPMAFAGSQVRQLAQYVSQEPDFAEALLSMPPGESDADVFTMLLNILRTALADHPDFADLHYYCSRALTRLGKVDQALHHARRCVRINPRFTRGLVELANLCVRADQPAAALQAVEQAIAQGADYADVHCLAGELMAQCRRPDKARMHLQRALQLNPNYHRAAQAYAALAA